MAKILKAEQVELGQAVRLAGGSDEPAASTVVAEASPMPAEGAEAEPSVRVVARDDHQVTLEVTCGCGRVIQLMCTY